MRITDFDLYKDLLKEKSGLTLTPDKSYLLDSRLTPVARKWGFDSLETMTMNLRGVPKPDLIKDVVEAMTTNETSFFRDMKPFDQFRDIVMAYMAKSRPIRKLRIWCAASSTGQEPYSLAMLLKENAAKYPGWSFEIVATDIDTAVLETAKKGEYSQFEVQRGLPIQLLMKYFEQKGDRWILKPDIRNMVQYKYFNLLDPLASLGKFDVIFCRNVLIYFDKETKEKVLQGMSTLIPEDGFLFLGGAETVLGITESFKLLGNSRGVYVRSDTKSLNDLAIASQSGPMAGAPLPLSGSTSAKA